MMLLALGFIGGAVWCLGAFVTMNVVSWTGPVTLALVGWPVILVIDVVDRLRERRRLRARR